MKGLILAGGHGTRLSPATLAVNKHLLPVADKPMILYAVEALRDAGIRDIILSITHVNPYGFMELLRDGDDYGVNISYVYQHGVEGIAWAINEARPWIDEEPLIVYLGDNIFADGIKNCIEPFMKNPTIPQVILKRVSNVQEASRYGVAKFSDAPWGVNMDLNEFYEEPAISEFIEKPEKPISLYIVLGLYCLTPKFFDVFQGLKPSGRGEYEITAALNALIPVGYRVYKGVWWDCGTFEDIHEASNSMRG